METTGTWDKDAAIVLKHIARAAAARAGEEAHAAHTSLLQELCVATRSWSARGAIRNGQNPFLWDGVVGQNELGLPFPVPWFEVAAAGWTPCRWVGGLVCSVGPSLRGPMRLDVMLVLACVAQLHVRIKLTARSAQSSAAAW